MSQDSDTSPAQKQLRSYAPTIAIAVALGLLAQFQIVGIAFVAIYAFISFRKHTPTRITAQLALISLGATAVTLTFGRRSVAENFATYSFLFLILLAIHVYLEQRRNINKLYKKHR